MKIWILNHYATDMYFDKDGRHHAFAKYLIRLGHDVKIFCANTVHNSNTIINVENNLYVEKIGADNVPYVFVKTRPYAGNGKDRILNMIDYYINIKPVLNRYKSKENLPDIILASSVHPLTLIAGIKWAHKNKINCICEIRDLWPETFVEMGVIKKNNILTKLLYRGEKWIYKNADKLIFTMEGGIKYIEDRKWNADINLLKVYYLNNGVDLEKFYKNKKEFYLEDDDLNSNYKKIVYTGSLRYANRLNDLIEVAKIFNDNKKDIKILIYGDGDYKEKLENECKGRELNNIIFKGKVDKKFIPYILSKGDINVVTGVNTGIGKYGVSWNKLFEYIASEKPIIANFDMGEYNIIENNGIGIAKRFDSPEDFSHGIMELLNKKNKIKNNNMKNKYDYKNLSIELLNIIEK